MHVSTFTYKGFDIELTYNNGFLAWGFQYEGQNYGTKVSVPSKKTIDVASIAFQLALNAIETYESISGLPGGVKED